jgi:hypothetical protein
MLELLPDDPLLGLRGHAELVREEGRYVPYRLPVTGQRALIHPDLMKPVRMPAGVRLDFETDATALEWDVEVAPVPGDKRPPAPFEATVNGELIARRYLSGRTTLVVEGMRRERKRVQIWLPQLGFPRLGPVRLFGATQVEAGAAQPRWIAYGSSITHCTGAHGPSRTWPALVAAANGWDLRCLGFAGQCQLDPVAARFIRDSPAELISLCLGVNSYRRATFSARSFGPAVTGFIQTVRDGQPGVPLVVQTPLAYPDGETKGNEVGLSVADLRAILVEAVAALRDSGYDNLHLIDGLTVLGPGEETSLADGLHPTAAGYELMATRLAPLLGACLPAGAPANA